MPKLSNVKLEIGHWTFIIRHLELVIRNLQLAMPKNLLLISVFVILLITYLKVFEQRSLFYPMREIEITPSAVGLDYEEVYFRAADGSLLNGWLIKNPKSAATVIFFHGNAGNISHRLDKLRFFHDLGLNVFIVDYRGYGKSQGRPSEEGIYRDARAAYDYLPGRPDFSGKIIAYGESLGGAAAIDLAVGRRLDALIVDSAFSSAKDMAKAVFPILPSFLVASKFNSQEKVKRIAIPKLFIHSANDEIVPFAQAEKLFKAAAAPKEFLKITGGHNSGFFESKDIIKEKVKSFLIEYKLLHN